MNLLEKLGIYSCLLLTMACGSQASHEPILLENQQEEHEDETDIINQTFAEDVEASRSIRQNSRTVDQRPPAVKKGPLMNGLIQDLNLLIATTDTTTLSDIWPGLESMSSQLDKSFGIGGLYSGGGESSGSCLALIGGLYSGGGGSDCSCFALIGGLYSGGGSDDSTSGCDNMPDTPTESETDEASAEEATPDMIPATEPDTPAPAETSAPKAVVQFNNHLVKLATTQGFSSYFNSQENANSAMQSIGEATAAFKTLETSFDPQGFYQYQQIIHGLSTTLVNDVSSAGNQ